LGFEGLVGIVSAQELQALVQLFVRQFLTFVLEEVAKII